MIKKQKTNFFNKNLQKSIKDLKKYSKYIWFMFLLFFAIGILGLAFPIFFEEQIINLIKNLLEKTKGLSAIELTRFIIINNTQGAFLGLTLGIFLGIFPLFMVIVNGYVLGFVANKSISIDGIFVLWKLLPHGIFEIPAIMISTGLGLMIGFSIMKDCIKNYSKKISDLATITLMMLSLLPFFIISILYASNPSIESTPSILTSILSFLSFIIFLTYMIFTFSIKKLRKSLFNNIISSLRIFIFIVIPLLLIGGIIEGILISIIN